MLFKLTVEYDVVVESQAVPDKAILDAVRNTPLELTLKSPDGQMFKVTLTPDVTYPSCLST
jgi:hypothetical protein